MEELTIDATLENMGAIIEYIEGKLEKYNCPMKIQMQLDVAVDELFSNIARYAYNPQVGPATVRVEVGGDPICVTITFIDHGKPYDPLKREDPNTGLSADEREIGGLGIFLVKKTMDDIVYEYKDGKNILKIRKNM